MTLDIDSESMNELIEFKKKLTTKNVIKVIFGTLISFGTAGAVIVMMKNPIKAAHGLAKLCMSMGVFTLGCKAGQMAEDYFKETVDALTDTVTEFKQELLTEGDSKDGADSEHGRNTEQQQKSADKCSKSSGEASASSVWWRRRGKKKTTE